MFLNTSGRAKGRGGVTNNLTPENRRYKPSTPRILGVRAKSRLCEVVQ
jgi:hypothetical protein